MDRLTDKSYRNYDYLSRYSSFPFYYDTEDERYIYGTTAQLKKDVSYVLHKVKPNDTWDSLALKYYNNPTLYWIICDFNEVQDPFTDLEVDTSIRIPTLSNISFEKYS